MVPIRPDREAKCRKKDEISHSRSLLTCICMIIFTCKRVAGRIHPVRASIHNGKELGTGPQPTVSALYFGRADAR